MANGKSLDGKLTVRVTQVFVRHEKKFKNLSERFFNSHIQMINIFIFLGRANRKEKTKRNQVPDDCVSTTSSDKISTDHLMDLREHYMNNIHQESTKRNYHSIWQNFNKFVIKLDRQPDKWEDKVSLYCAYLIRKDVQSATLKSYVSAIKSKLIIDGYRWSDDWLWFNTLTRACKLKNDTVKNRLPIHGKLLECTLFELRRKFTDEIGIGMTYRRSLYTTFFLLAYHGLFRIGELAYSQHVIKARDVHITRNNKTMIVVLRSSKTHTLAMKPQKITIRAEQDKNKNFCPIIETRKYTSLRKQYDEDDEQFFVYENGSPVLPMEIRKLLKEIMSNMGLDCQLYDTHSFRIGRATDLFNQGFGLEYIKKSGRWKSNAVYKYLRD